MIINGVKSLDISRFCKHSAWKASGHATDYNGLCQVAPNIYVFLEQRFYDSLVNCYLIEQDNCVVLIDGPQQLSKEHEDFILNFGKPVEVILSHAATSSCVAKLRQKLKARIWMHANDSLDEWLVVQPDSWLSGGELFGQDLIVLHTPGHSPGSITLFDARNKILFTGDHVAGALDGSVRDVRNDKHARGTMTERFASIDSLMQRDFDAIFPFHYQAICSNARVALKSFLEGVKNAKK